MVLEGRFKVSFAIASSDWDPVPFGLGGRASFADPSVREQVVESFGSYGICWHSIATATIDFAYYVDYVDVATDLVGSGSC